MDMAEVSAAAAALLATGALNEAGKDLTDAARSVAHRLLQIVTRRFRDDEQALSVLGEVTRNPTDGQAVARLAAGLKGHLEADQEFAHAIHGLMLEINQEQGRSSDQIFNVQLNDNTHIKKVINIGVVEGDVNL